MIAKNVLVLSDDDLLSEVIELALGEYTVQTVSIPGEAPSEPGQPDLDHTDLIIVALGSFNSEPVVALAKTALSGVIGRIPLLIISSKRFQPDDHVPIYHLDFPFNVRELQAQVRRAMRRPNLVRTD